MKVSPYTPAKPQGFTLIELLTVIAIIGILAAIIIPTVGSVRRNARESVNKSNLRQIAMAANLFGADNKDQFPYTYYPATVAGIHGSQSGDGWYDVMIPYLTKAMGSGFHRSAQRPILRSPTAAIPSDDSSGRVCHYSMHAAIGSDVSARRVPRMRISRPSQVILFCDGAQSEGGTLNNAAPSFNRPNAIEYGFSGNLSDPVSEYTAATNLDSSRAYPRFRNGANNTLHAAMIDGSVKAFKIGEVTYGNIVADK